jgi:predicted TIM-barrel fold metal-dependent hydrolase
MMSGLVIDADAHVLETEHTWDYLEPSEQKYRPLLVTASSDPTQSFWVVDGEVAGLRLPTLTEKMLRSQSAELGRDIVTPEAARGLDDVPLRLRHMDDLGIDVQVLHNSMWIRPVTKRPDTEMALCRSWNRWMADVWKEGGGRLRWTCVLPTLTMDAAVEELRFAHEHGAAGVCLRAYDHGLMITDPVYYPMFEEASRLDMPIAVHVSNGSSEFEDLIKSRYPVRAGFVSFGLPAVASCFALLASEVPRVFPKLRWAFIEASAGWIPWLLHNLLRRFGPEYPTNPFAAFNVFVTTQMDDDHQYILDYVGNDVLVLGTDYGHSDVSSEVDSMKLFRKLDTVSDETKHKVLSLNPMRLYGIPNE